MHLSSKQKQFWLGASHRWNIKTGATRSGKTYLDYYLIPRRIRACNGSGLILLLGNTKGTLERNILEPMRSIWGGLVGNIGSDNKVNLFGRNCYALGADKVNQVTKIQGAGFEYVYGDEITTWHTDVFQMLKSRLDKPNSCFDGTCNPDNPNHWFKAFLDGDADIYHQHYTIDDNPFLTPQFVDNLKREYAGTVYYDRFILGLWTAAEGLIYRQFADREDDYLAKNLDSDYLKDVEFVSVGVDFGGTRSLTAFVASAVHRNFSKITAVADYHIKGRKGDIDADRLCQEFVGFVQRLRTKFPQLYIRYVFADSEAQYLINSLRAAVRRNGLGIEIADSAKYKITDRIIAANTLLNTGRMLISKDCEILRGGLRSAAWDKNRQDARLDNFSSDIDILDAFEYSWERFIPRLCPTMKQR